MANTATLLQLRDRAKRHADLENTQFLLDPEWDNLLNLGGSELWDLLVDSNEDWCTATTTLGPGTATPFVAGTTLYALPGDVLKLLQVDNVIGVGQRFNIDRLPHGERNQGWPGRWCEGYRQFGSSIEFLPSAPSQGTVEVRYVPQWTLLTADGSVVPALIPVGWEEYIPLWAAVRAMSKARVDASTPAQLLADIRERIKNASADRDTNAPARVADVSGRFARRPSGPRWRGG
jgi:hypothetical protein